MSDLHRIIRRPIITERGTDMKDKYNKTVFEVGVGSNKREIKKAVEKIFDVTVLKVHTISQIGKKKRFSRTIGKRPDWKKAIVTLKAGDQIELLEGM